VRAAIDVDWHDATTYALVLNTGQMSVETAADLVIRLARTPRFAETDESRQRLADVLLAARIREALGERGIPDMGLELRAVNGIVTVQGALVANENIGHILDIVRQVDGVREVHDEVQVVPFGYGA
jgi:hypothetical protein